MKKRAISYPTHKLGKHCGYDEFEDGSIKVAPTYSDLMEEAADKTISLIKPKTGTDVDLVKDE